MLEQQIIDRIKAKGALSVSDFMQIALQDETHGYYRKQDPIGKAGDFVTSPEISQIFGELIAAWLIDSWTKIGAPEHVFLVEAGPGKGHLMSDILRVFKKHAPFYQSLEVILVETSEALKEVQREKLKDFDISINWADDLTTLPWKPMLFIANEFLDALPIDQYIYQNGNWYERKIGLDENEKLHFIQSDKPSTLTLPSNAEDGDIAEHSPASESAISIITEHIGKHNGVGLVVDYGYTQGHGDTFQAMKNHTYVNTLEHIGDADLTAHVDFAHMQKTANESTTCHMAVTQGEFLRMLGIDMRTEQLAMLHPNKANSLREATARLVDPDKMGELFKCLAIQPNNTPTLLGF